MCPRDLVYRRALPIQKHSLVDTFPWWRCTCCPADSVRSETDSWGPAVLRHTLQHVTGVTSSQSDTVLHHTLQHDTGITSLAVKLTAGALPSCVTLCNIRILICFWLSYVVSCPVLANSKEKTSLIRVWWWWWW